MKEGIHPTYNSQATISCACGTTYTIGSTQESVDIELCANCHPFYTGKQKIVDTARRVEKFKARNEQADASPTGHAAKLAKKAARAKAREDKRAKAEAEA